MTQTQAKIDSTRIEATREQINKITKALADAMHDAGRKHYNIAPDAIINMSRGDISTMMHDLWVVEYLPLDEGHKLPAVCSNNYQIEGVKKFDRVIMREVEHLLEKYVFPSTLFQRRLIYYYFNEE